MAFVTDMAAKRAEISPDRTAFIDVTSGARLTFEGVEARANRMARALLALGVRRGDRVALLARNHADVFVLLFAAQKTGILLLPLNWRQPAAELAATMTLAAPVMLLHDEASRETAEALGVLSGLEPLAFADARSEAGTKAARFLEAVEAVASLPTGDTRVDGEAPWYLLATSGTTGTPKLVIQTAGMAWANAVNYTQATDLTGTDRSVNFLPLFHTAGINLLTLPLFLAGGASRVLAKFEAASVLSLIGSGEITAFFGVPAIYQALALEETFDATDFSCVRSLGCGGAPMPAPLLERYLARGVTVCNGMGMTETGPTVFLSDPERAAEKIGSVGKAQMLADVRLVDAAGKVVEGEGEGELQIRGPGVTLGYFANERATAEAFAEGGWLRSGDVARRDADGYFSIVDRIKDMYISGGENVYPAEVERVLVAHPDVLEAVVVGVPDERWGETGAAWLIPRPGARPDGDELVAWCRERLAGYKVPRYIEIAGDLPRTAAGKVQKHVLKDRLEGTHAQRMTGKGKT
ncbi:MAG: acid--CoA ligase [Stappia sp.]|uniref:AMP-binding protein n=1 Tax=Stappia sp. TaxID=1870903 RepID=UPI000C5F4367|nr:AMP-binding protein [Stappia sp.]MAB00227.1 acid--CoA ligase [Stappia sp.]MBM21048.1 acid--CoA ligase [Stappia sp.]|tara:strand:+ start:752 stop:2320 length:1569 start_codon:yes stop_codon:yes gene_type:complete